MGVRRAEGSNEGSKVRRKEGGKVRTDERGKEGRRSMDNICESGPTYEMDASINARRIDPKWRERMSKTENRAERSTDVIESVPKRSCAERWGPTSQSVSHG